MPSPSRIAATLERAHALQQQMSATSTATGALSVLFLLHGYWELKRRRDRDKGKQMMPSPSSASNGIQQAHPKIEGNATSSVNTSDQHVPAQTRSEAEDALATYVSKVYQDFYLTLASGTGDGPASPSGGSNSYQLSACGIVSAEESEELLTPEDRIIRRWDCVLDLISCHYLVDLDEGLSMLKAVPVQSHSHHRHSGPSPAPEADLFLDAALVDLKVLCLSTLLARCEEYLGLPICEVRNRKHFLPADPEEVKTEAKGKESSSLRVSYRSRHVDRFKFSTTECDDFLEDIQKLQLLCAAEERESSGAPSILPAGASLKVANDVRNSDGSSFYLHRWRNLCVAIQAHQRIQLIRLELHRQKRQNFFNTFKWIIKASNHRFGSSMISAASTAVIGLFRTGGFTLGKQLEAQVKLAVSQCFASEPSSIGGGTHSSTLAATGSHTASSEDGSTSTATAYVSLIPAGLPLIGKLHGKLHPLVELALLELLRRVSLNTLTLIVKVVMQATTARFRELVKKELHFALCRVPLSFFSTHDEYEMDQILCFPNDLEGVDLHVQFALLDFGYAAVSVLSAYRAIGGNWRPLGLLFASVIFTKGFAKFFSERVLAVLKKKGISPYSPEPDRVELETGRDGTSRTLMQASSIVENIPLLRPHGADETLMRAWYRSVEDGSDDPSGRGQHDSADSSDTVALSGLDGENPLDLKRVWSVKMIRSWVKAWAKNMTREVRTIKRKVRRVFGTIPFETIISGEQMLTMYLPVATLAAVTTIPFKGSGGVLISLSAALETKQVVNDFVGSCFRLLECSEVMQLNGHKARTLLALLNSYGWEDSSRTMKLGGLNASSTDQQEASPGPAANEGLASNADKATQPHVSQFSSTSMKRQKKLLQRLVGLSRLQRYSQRQSCNTEELLPSTPSLVATRSSDFSSGSASSSFQFDALRIRALTFAYPSRLDRLVLDGLSIELPLRDPRRWGRRSTEPTRGSIGDNGNNTAHPACLVAVTGTSGCGKSTILQLLLKLFTPEKGSIELVRYSGRSSGAPASAAHRLSNGEAVEEGMEAAPSSSSVFLEDPAGKSDEGKRTEDAAGTGGGQGLDLRLIPSLFLRQSVFAYVPQRVPLFTGTLAQNIALKQSVTLLDDATMAMVREAGLVSGCAKFVAELPEGYNTKIGEKGVILSGGQAQRIGIARAIFQYLSNEGCRDTTEALRSATVNSVQALLLDEPTASLDAATKLSIILTLRQGIVNEKDLPVVVVTHDPLVVEHADVVVRMVVDGAAASSEPTPSRRKAQVHCDVTFQEVPSQPLTSSQQL